MRILTGTLMHETNTFNASPTKLEDFKVLQGHELFEHEFWRGNAESTGGIIETLQAEGADVVPTVHAVAMVSGIVEDEAYVKIKQMVMDAVRSAGQIDGICFCLHGSMYTRGVQDPEGDLMKAIRELVGERLPIVCALDMHATITEELLQSVNAFTVFRTAPHTDRYDCGVRAAELLLRIIRRGLDVVTVGARLPFLVCGENSMTTVLPMKDMIAEAYAVSRMKQTLNADYTLGFPWADTPHHGVWALVSGESLYLNELREIALDMAEKLWEQRDEFRFSEESHELDSALDIALETKGTVMLADTGDNPTAGASSNLTIVLEKLHQRNIKHALVAVIADADSYTACRSAGPGQSVELKLGRRQPNTEESYRVQAHVRSVHDDIDAAGHSKERCNAAVVVIGEVDVIVTERRIAVYDPQFLQQLGVHVEDYRLIVVKSGYLSPAYRELGSRTLFALTPGQSNISLSRIVYEQAPRPIYPHEPNTAWNRDAERKRMTRAK
jgi:microcystin degradation protein MlrC